MTRILQYNLPFYAGSLALCLLAVLSLQALMPPSWLRISLVAFIAGTAFWSIASLLVSYYVYDRSPLYGFAWMREALDQPPACWLNIHNGLDEIGPAGRSVFPEANYQALDVFDPKEMTEPAIRRARRVHLSKAPHASFRSLPWVDQSWDLVTLVFCAHELRSAPAREAFFRELRRVLNKHGVIILVEHLRDTPNLLAFGPGVLHFLTRREWVRVTEAAGLQLLKDTEITPFVHALVLRPLPIP